VLRTLAEMENLRKRTEREVSDMRQYGIASFARDVLAVADTMDRALKALDAKALKLTGGPDSPAPPPNRSIYGVVIAEDKADIFLTYCTNAMQAVREVPGARIVAIPEALAIGADYGLTTLNNAPTGAQRLAVFILSPPAQAILARHGFVPGRSS